MVQVDSNSTSSVNNANNHPIFYTVDTSDSTVPTAITDIMQYNDCKIAYMFKGFTIYFKPKYTDTASAMAGVGLIPLLLILIGGVLRLLFPLLALTGSALL